MLFAKFPPRGARKTSDVDTADIKYGLTLLAAPTSWGGLTDA
jgi:hypothetical protein